MSHTRANLALLTDRVNTRSRRAKPYDPTYISSVRSGRRGSDTLKTIVREEEAKLLREAAAAVESPESAPTPAR